MSSAISRNDPHTRVRPLDVLRVRDFRRFWLALLVQVCGLMMFQFTLGWLAFEITGSPAQLGLIHLCGFAPQIVLTLLGGVLADRWDPRHLIGVAQLVGAVGMFALGALTLLGFTELWHLALASFLIGVSTSIDEPSRSVFFPRLLADRAQLRAAVPLISMAWGGTRIIAPSIAGFVIAAGGAHASFLVAACGLSTMVAVIWMVKPVSAPTAAKHGSVLGNFTASLAYVRGNDVFLKVILAALLNALAFILNCWQLPSLSG